jgi:hypothetical protein
VNDPRPSERPKLAIAWWVFFALAGIVGSLSAKYLTTMTAYLSGVFWVPPRSYPFYSMGAVFSIGLMIAAPFWSAMFFALTPFSRLTRLIVALIWFGIAVLAQFLGSQALPDFDSPSAFRPEALAILPIATLGWCLPFVLMRVFRGWQIQVPGSKAQSLETSFSITSLLTGTFLVALCFAALTMVQPPVHVGGLIAMSMALVVGFIALPLVWFTLRTRRYVLFWIGFAAFVFAVSCGVVFWVFGPRGSFLSLSGLFAAFSIAILSPFVGARIYGARLITNRDIWNRRPQQLENRNSPSLRIEAPLVKGTGIQIRDRS